MIFTVICDILSTCVLVPPGEMGADIACGSGKFPTALASHAHIAEASIKTVDYSLLDPSKFSVAVDLVFGGVLPPKIKAAVEIPAPPC